MKANCFKPILLEEMDQVKLMNRIDRKYWFSIEDLQEVLQSVQNQYMLLQIEGQDQLSYATTYYDTSFNEMFVAHHNGKLNRYKIRKRCYVNSGISFLEIKFKNNKGRTIKKRMPTNFSDKQFTAEEVEFIQSKTPYKVKNLKVKLVNNFTRLTLVNRNFKERCTIDLNVHFEQEDKAVDLNNLVIVEIKSDAQSSSSPLAVALRNLHHNASGFSKYCIGRTLTDYSLKRNAFKAKIRSIEKVIHFDQNLYKIV